MNTPKEPYITSDLRPRVVPLLETSAPLDPELDDETLRQAALEVLGLSDSGWSALHPDLSGEDVMGRRYGHHPEVTGNTLDEETVLLHVKTSRYYTLNGSGTLLWDLFDGERSLADICRSMEEMYDIEHSAAQRDVIAFAGQLRAEELIGEIS